MRKILARVLAERIEIGQFDLQAMAFARARFCLKARSQLLGIVPRPV